MIFGPGPHSPHCGAATDQESRAFAGSRPALSPLRFPPPLPSRRNGRWTRGRHRSCPVALSGRAPPPLRRSAPRISPDRRTDACRLSGSQHRPEKFRLSSAQALRQFQGRRRLRRSGLSAFHSAPRARPAVDAGGMAMFLPRPTSSDFEGCERGVELERPPDMGVDRRRGARARHPEH